jgi:hypothetical protein
LPVDEYVDKMKAGWVGQMVGVGWSGPTEFRVKGKIMPAEQMPKWQPQMVDQFRQDDIYVEMTFQQTLDNAPEQVLVVWTAPYSNVLKSC